MSQTPLHDWLLPRLAALLAQAREAGFEADAVVAVATDLLARPRFNNAVPAPTAADAADPGQPEGAGQGIDPAGTDGFGPDGFGTAARGPEPSLEPTLGTPRRAATHLRRGSRW